MKFGITSIFAFRPHVAHLAYLARVLEGAGHDVVGFDCLSAVGSCYARNLKNTPRHVECPKCMIGGLRTYPIKMSATVRKSDRVPLENKVANRLTISSAATVFRTEDPTELEAEEFLGLQADLRPSVETVYGSARRWIRSGGLDGVLFFNGRMDLTAAVMQACRDCGVPFASVERAWLGHGIHITPMGNALDLDPYDHLCEEFIGSPLTADQAQRAGRLAAQRFLRTNRFEWRLYNEHETRTVWPGNGDGLKVLVLPSSRNEFEGHPQRMCPWPDYPWAIQEVIRRLGPTDVVLRCHPNWGETISGRPGFRAERHYRRWATEQGHTAVPSADTRSTYDLIEAADVIIVNGSSTGVEAGLIGKKVVSVGRCTYQSAGFTVQIHDEDQFERLEALDTWNSREVSRRALRYLLLHAVRAPQFVDFVRAKNPAEYEFLEGADPGRLLNLITTGQLHADDGRVGRDESAEDVVLARIEERDWETLHDYRIPDPDHPKLPVPRRRGFRWVDRLRARLPRGDRA